eukprot:3558863-Pleurochrysis_carterae.AAC.1
MPAHAARVLAHRPFAAAPRACSRSVRARTPSLRRSASCMLPQCACAHAVPSPQRRVHAHVVCVCARRPFAAAP